MSQENPQGRDRFVGIACDITRNELRNLAARVDDLASKTLAIPCDYGLAADDKSTLIRSKDDWMNRALKAERELSAEQAHVAGLQSKLAKTE